MLTPQLYRATLWGLRGILLIALLTLWSAPSSPLREHPSKASTPRVSLDSPQQVETLDSRLCVHTRLTDEVEDYKILDSLRMVREMGATTIVEFLPWPYVEVERGKYDWYHPDRIIKYAENQGLRIIARLGLVPWWAQGEAENPTLNYLPESEFGTFASYVGTFAARYRGRVNHLLIWNEPNLNFEWGNRPPDPEAYTQLLRLSYESAHAANPDVIVLNGPLSPTLAPPGGAEGGWNDLDFLRRMYEAGAADYFDVMAVHNYPFTYAPRVDPAADQLNFRRIELWREIMMDYGDGDKPIYITETGWNDHPRFAYAVPPIQRINYTLDMFDFTKEAYPWLETICLWQFRLPAPTNSYPDYFTLVSTDFEPKPIYEAIQAYARGGEP